MGKTDKAYRDLIGLVSCAVNSSVPDESVTDEMDHEAVFDLAAGHMVSAMTAMALESAGNGDARCGQTIGLALLKTAAFEDAKKKILEALEQQGIWYLPLKGMILKDLYPQYGMREMSDHDILVDAERMQDVRRIMKEQGFSAHEDGNEAHEAFFRNPFLNFEIHHQLFSPGSDEKLYRYYLNVKDRLVKDPDNAFGWHFSPEDFYIYMIAHAGKHAHAGGNGLRLLTDIFVYRRKTALDDAYIAGELEKLGLSEFEREIRSLAMDLFSGKPLSSAEEMTLEDILQFSPLRVYEHWIKRDLERACEEKSGKPGYVISRIFPSMDQIKEADPFFYRNKILLPFFLPYRVVRAIFTRRKKLFAEIKAFFKS